MQNKCNFEVRYIFSIGPFNYSPPHFSGSLIHVLVQRLHGFFPAEINFVFNSTYEILPLYIFIFDAGKLIFFSSRGDHVPGEIRHHPESVLEVFNVIPVICFGYQVGVYRYWNRRQLCRANKPKKNAKMTMQKIMQPTHYYLCKYGPFNECSNRSIEVQLPTLFVEIMTDRPTNQPTDQ